MAENNSITQFIVPTTTIPEAGELPKDQHARLPCVICGVDLMYDAPDPTTGLPVAAMNVHTAWQPFVCQRCFWAAKDVAERAAQPIDPMDSSEPSDDQMFDNSVKALDYNEGLARTLIMMARDGYLGQSMRRPG